MVTVGLLKARTRREDKAHPTVRMETTPRHSQTKPSTRYNNPRDHTRTTGYYEPTTMIHDLCSPLRLTVIVLCRERPFFAPRHQDIEPDESVTREPDSRCISTFVR